MMKVVQTMTFSDNATSDTDLKVTMQLTSVKLESLKLHDNMHFLLIFILRRTV